MNREEGWLLFVACLVLPCIMVVNLSVDREDQPFDSQ